MADEIRYFKKIGKGNSIYAVVIDGDPGATTVEEGKCFPDPLQFDVDNQGEINIGRPAEPLAADFRLTDGTEGWTSQEAYSQSLGRSEKLTKKEINGLVSEYAERQELAKLKLISGILSVPLGVLQKREKAYQLKLARKRARTLRLWLGALSVLTVTAIAAATWASRAESETRHQLEQSRLAEGKTWLEMARLANDEKRPMQAAMRVGRAVGFRGFGWNEEYEEKFGETIPSLLGEPFVTSEELERERREQLASAKEMVRKFDLLMQPLWSKKSYNGDPWSQDGSLAYSPDGSQLAGLTDSNTIKIWDSANGRMVATLEGRGGVAWSPDGSQLASGAEGDTVNIWDASRWKVMVTMDGHSAEPYSFAWSPDGNWLASGALLNAAKIWEASSGKEVATLKHHGEFGHAALVCVSWSPNGKMLASGGFDNMVRIWDVSNWKEVTTLEGPNPFIESRVRSVSWSPDGSRLAIGSENGTVDIRDVSSWKAVASFFHGEKSIVSSVTWSPDGGRLASGAYYDDGMAKIWDVSSGEEKMILDAKVNSVKWSPDGSRFATNGNSLAVWEMSGGEEDTTLALPIDRDSISTARCVSWSPDGNWLACGTDYSGRGPDAMVAIWEVSSGKPLVKLGDLGNIVKTIKWSPDGSRLGCTYFTGATGELKIWEVSSEREMVTLGEDPTKNAPIFDTMNWSPDGTRFACGMRDGRVEIRDSSSGKVVATLGGNSEHAVDSVVWSPDGGRLANAAGDGKVMIWDVLSGEVLLEVGRSIRGVDWSPDGTRLACGTRDGVEIWDSSNGKVVTTLNGGSGSVAWHPDGRWLASTSGGTVIILEVWSGKVVANLKFHEKSYHTVPIAWSPDGSRLACGFEGAVKILNPFRLDISDIADLLEYGEWEDTEFVF